MTNCFRLLSIVIDYYWLSFAVKLIVFDQSIVLNHSLISQSTFPFTLSLPQGFLTLPLGYTWLTTVLEPLTLSPQACTFPLTLSLPQGFLILPPATQYIRHDLLYLNHSLISPTSHSPLITLGIPYTTPRPHCSTHNLFEPPTHMYLPKLFLTPSLPQGFLTLPPVCTVHQIYATKVIFVPLTYLPKLLPIPSRYPRDSSHGPAAPLDHKHSPVKTKQTRS